MEPINQKTILHRLIQLRNDSLADPTNPKYDALFTETTKYSWSKYVNQALGFAKLILLSNYNTESKFGNIAIHSFNCPEWFIAAIGAMFARKFFCGIYNTNNAEQCLHVVQTGDCGILVIENYTLLLEKYADNNTLEHFRKNKIQIVVINNDKPTLINPNALNIFDGITITDWESLDLSAYTKDTEFEKILDYVSLDDICTLIFTSGTTASPKGCIITHKNICTVVEGVLDKLDIRDYEERFVSYLPLSHIAGQALDIYAPIYCKAQVHFAKPDALRGSLQQTLVAVRPTVFFGVPRVWEKFREALITVSNRTYSDGWSGRALGSIMGVVKDVEKQCNTSKGSMLSPLTFVTSRVVNKIKEKIGLDQCRYFATGAAPISRDVLEYFSSIGICIFELYGMSETCGIICVSDHINSVKGSCGTAIKDVSIKIGTNDEILVKGNNVFRGYYNSTVSDDIDDDGFLHTGDCGRLDDNGYLYITGRIKELLITAGGENIPPVKIEDNINSGLDQSVQSAVQLMLIGDKKKFLTMLVFSSALTETDKGKVSDNVESSIRAYNKDKAISNSQKVQNFKVINESLTIENGMLTPTMKFKRSKIVEKYSDVIESMYADM